MYCSYFGKVRVTSGISAEVILEMVSFLSSISSDRIELFVSFKGGLFLKCAVEINI